MPPPSPSDSLGTLYVAHHSWLQDWLRRRLGNAWEAADLAQEAFLRLLVKPRAFTDAGHARAYLRGMASNMCADLWRRREVEQAWLETLAQRPEAYAASAEDQLIVLQALQEIDAMLRALPERAARAFVLAVGCEMTHREVAAEMGVSERMVRKYVAQATLHCMLHEARNPAPAQPQFHTQTGIAP
ncbi:sigma-70 family RNA polymerase sigma factor [Achromobacter spanius]|uniref:sigma-70 family RNA polymerase sigma factor n=1 Tax=Achromobacter spanius TaxID=217203 RepID=UPI0038196043